MAKPKPKRINSDTCAVMVDGDVCYPHEGEYVELYRGQTVGELQAIAEMQRLGVEIQALEGEPDANAKAVALLAPHFDALCGYLGKRIVDWNWTDDQGEPLAKPDRSGIQLRDLSAQEIMWLLAAAMGETPAERKNELAPSPTTS